jgi:5-methylcytosine-specific restriction endonuclease McrA
MKNVWTIAGENIKRNVKRTLGIRDRQILYERAKHKCEACGERIEFSEMQAGHKTAASRGGSATLNNSVCLCYRCNKLQGTDSWSVFMSKLRKKTIKKQKQGGRRMPKRKAVRNLLTGKIDHYTNSKTEVNIFTGKRQKKKKWTI